MRYTKRRPNFMVRVVRPDYRAGGGFDDVAYFPSERVGGDQRLWSDQLLSYSFSERIDSIDTEFTFSVTPEVDRGGKSWMDKIQPRDVAVFTEFGVVRYVGVITRVRYYGRMDDTPNRSITISGMSVGGILSTYRIILDQRIYRYHSTADALNQQFMAKLTSALNEGDAFRQVLISIYESFMALMQEVGRMGEHEGVGVVFSRYLDYQSGIDDDVKTHYPIHLTLYTVGANDIWSIWEGVVQRPIHELFGRWNAGTGRYQIVFRQAPFDHKDWAALPIHDIDPLWVKSVEVGLSDDDIYTFFSSYFPGSGVSRSVAIGTADYAGTAVIDEDHWAQYGYRPMEMTFKYFDRSMLEKFNSTEGLMKRMNRMVKGWYEKNSEFLNGTIEMMTVPNAYVRIGERLRYLSGEFYVEGTTRSWSYGGPMVTRLTITRGYRYDAGKYTGPIRDLGESLKRTEVMA